ncbi:MAG: glycosyltransferase family 39 protein [Spirochaetia bacterium]|nr:glycosyltransferase family 39 protein [Spirochaetia bacterium]
MKNRNNDKGTVAMNLKLYGPDAKNTGHLQSWNMLDGLLVVLTFIISQYFYFSYIGSYSANDLFFFYYFLAFAFFAAVLIANSAGGLHLLALVCLFAGWRESYLTNQSMFAFFYYGLFTLVLWYAKTGEGQGAEGREKNFTIPAQGRGLYALLAAVILLFLTFNGFMRGFFYDVYVHDRELLDFLPLRDLGICSNDICSAPFRKYHILLLPGAFMVLAGAVYAAVSARLIKRRGLILLALVLVAMLGKLSVISLSTDGFGTIARKIAAPIDCAYYHFAKQITDPFTFVRQYTELYQGPSSIQYSHLKGHPPLATLFYWIIIRFTGPNPFIVGLVFMLLTSLTVLPIFFLVKRLFNNEQAGFNGAFLYALTPFSAILSSSGIDSVILFLIILFLSVYSRASASGKMYYFFLAGFIFGVNTLVTFGTWPVLAVLPLFYLYWNRQLGKTGIIQFSVALVTVAAGIVLAHIVFQSFFAFGFDYIRAFKAARTVVRDISGRPYILWVWGNFVHWGIFLSAPLFAAFLYRLTLSMTGRKPFDPYTAGSVAVLAIFFLSCMGRAEQHRQWMFLFAFVLPQVLSVFYENTKEGVSFNRLKYAVFAVLVFINTIIIEVKITDAQ